MEMLVPILAILVGGAIVIIPIAGLTARLALRPIVESLSQLRDGRSGGGDRLASVERRVALLEEQVQTLERDNARLLEEAEFRRLLEK